MAADVALAGENSLNRVIVSDRRWWERWGGLTWMLLGGGVVGSGGSDGQHAGCGRMWPDGGGGKKTGNVAVFDQTLLDLGSCGPCHRCW